MEASSAAWWRRASSRKSEIMALAAWFGISDPCGIGVGGQLERDVVAELGLAALHITVVEEDVLALPILADADEAVGLAQIDDLARVPLAAHPWLQARVRGKLGAPF